MPRGGKRDKAGRKSSWSSGVKFEDTSLVRIPSYLKGEVLKLAHKLDAGDCIDLSQMQSQISMLEDENARLKQELQENRINSIVNDFNVFLEPLHSKIKDWRQKAHKLRPIDSASFLNEILSELQILVSQEQFKRQINNQVFSDSIPQKNTQEQAQNKIVTKSKDHIQLDLLPASSGIKFAPLNNSDLAKRLKVDCSNLSKKRRKSTDNNFFDYTKSKDPDGIGWIYSEGDKLYFPKN